MQALRCRHQLELQPLVAVWLAVALRSIAR
jgi:hypothetical protein